MHQMTRKRIMERAGFVHVSGWVRAERAPAIKALIDQDKEQAKAALVTPPAKE